MSASGNFAPRVLAQIWGWLSSVLIGSAAVLGGVVLFCIVMFWTAVSILAATAVIWVPFAAVVLIVFLLR